MPLELVVEGAASLACQDDVTEEACNEDLRCPGDQNLEGEDKEACGIRQLEQATADPEDCLFPSIAWLLQRSAANGPCLLGRTRVGEFGVTTLKVKNTFIECEIDDDDDGPPMVGIKSCPVPCLSAPREAPAGSPSRAAASSAWQAPAPPRAAPAAAPPAAPSHQLPTPAPSPQPQQPTEVCEPQARQLMGGSEVVPLELRTPQPSCGSLQHGTGLCRPCAWYWRPQGCSNGRECRHCHMCSKGEVKARRRTRHAAVRGQAQREHRR